MLLHSRIPLKFWVDVFNTATFIINRLLTPTLHGVFLFEMLVYLILCLPYVSLKVSNQQLSN
jgi:hypothetical protein